MTEAMGGSVKLSGEALRKLDALQDHREATMGTRLSKKATLEALIHREWRELELDEVSP